MQSFAIVWLTLAVFTVAAAHNSNTFPYNDNNSEEGMFVPRKPVNNMCSDQPCHSKALCTDLGRGLFNCVCTGNLVGDGITTCDEPRKPMEISTNTAEQQRLLKRNKKKAPTKSPTSMPTSVVFVQAPLPYAFDALEPFGMTAETFEFHYGKHHKAYVDNLNSLISGKSEFLGKSLVEIIRMTTGNAAQASIFNNAAQVWNHDFFWASLQPSGGGPPTGSLRDAIEASFGTYDDFKSLFTTAALTQFGSGWVWLVLEDEALKITKTSNADNPWTQNQKPLLTLDVWEHAYYIDFRNSRASFIANYLDNLVNWDFVSANLLADV